MFNKSKYFIFAFSIILLLNVKPLFGQFGRETAREKAAKEEINNELKSRFGENSYKVQDIIDVNYRKGNYKFYLTPLEDPYGTLKNCFIFVTAIDGTGENAYRPQFKVIPKMIGIYKDGKIIWLSKKEIGEYEGGFLLLTRDLNNDGNVEIITEWNVGRVGSDLWIHSWDGNTGWRINTVEDPNWPYFSKLGGLLGSWGLFDFEGDGILEIKNYNGSIYETYSWNGSEYGKWQNTPQYTGKEWLPRNNMKVKVSCKVSKGNNQFEYKYKVENLHVSKQRINTVYVQVKADSFTTQMPNNDWTRKLHYLYNLNGWTIKAYGGKGYIEPGKSLNGFIKKSEALPFIGKYFIRADNELPDIVSMDAEELFPNKRKDLYNNSVIGNTIGLSDPPTPFVTLGFIDTLKSYTDSSYALGWIKDEPTRDKYDNYFANAKSYLNQYNNNAAKSELQKVLTDCNADSSSVLTSEAYALLYFNTDYLIKQIPEVEPGLPVKLEDSQGNLVQGGSLQYYDGGWKDATDNGDGTFTVQTEKSTVSLKMTYAGASQQLNNVTVGPDTAVFQTVNTTVKLLNSQGAAIDTGTVKYYASGWKDLGTTVNGIAAKELLPKEYSFRMNYGGASLDKKQNISDGAAVVFQTVNAKVQLKDSQGNLLDGGSVQYYASGWKDFGTAANGEVTKELLPKEYSFRMSYGGASLDKKQNISDGSAVVFQTVNAKVQLKDSQGNLLDGGTVKYYASGWKDFGTAANGEATKELLPKEYSFRMNYGGASLDKKQNISDGAAVVFQTVNTKVRLKDSQGNLLDGGSVKYYASGWKDFGTATNGEATKELLPKEYSFRMSYGGASIDEKNDISLNQTLVFNTINTIVRVSDGNGQPINNALASYYASGWKQIGNTINGEINKELLPKNYSFRVNNNGVNQDKQQDINVNNIVEFIFE